MVFLISCNRLQTKWVPQVLLMCPFLRCGHMARSWFVKIPLILFLLLSLMLSFQYVSQRRETSSPSTDQERCLYPVRITGLSYSTFDDDKLIIKIKADEFKVNPRKYFAFNIRPFNEATLTNARLNVHLYEERSSEVDPFSFGEVIFSLNKKGAFSMKEMGLITRGVIKGLALEVYKVDKLSLVITAREVIIDFKSKEARLIMASIEDILSKKLITSRSVIWSGKEKIFKIPGAYRAVTSRGKTSGRGIKMDLKGNVGVIS